MKRKIAAIAIIAAVIAAMISYRLTRSPSSLVLTGIVTTDDVQVSSQIQGRIQELLVRQGDTVKKGQLLAVIQPQEWQADKDYYKNSERESAEQVETAKANLEFQEAQTGDQIRQSQAALDVDRAQLAQARADLEYSEITLKRAEAMRSGNINSQQDFDQARTNCAAARAHVEALAGQVRVSEAALALSQANAIQVTARKATLDASSRHLEAARHQTEKADVYLNYTRIYAPVDGIVDVRAALQGEVVTAGEAIVTLVNPDDLWVRADIEESYIDGIHLGEKMTVRLPSGAGRTGTVFYRGVDADYATQRDVSRTKRDIKTFEIRLRCDNSDRSLALGSTAYVTLPLR